MVKHTLSMVTGALSLAAWLTWNGPTAGQTPARPPPGTTSNSSHDERGRGPAHETLDGPNAQPRPPLNMTHEPPAAIEELAPDRMTQGNNVQWIGGYWSRDSAGNFRWVSGLWLNLPTGRQWVPGIWIPQRNGWQRVPGFWTQWV